MEDRFSKIYSRPRDAFSGIARLFTGDEVKSFFQRYIFVIVLIEVGIFIACWMYQLGLVGEDRFGHITRAFPWKTYFLMAFLAPVTLTFLLGLVVGAFNIFLHGELQQDAEGIRAGGPRWLRSLLQIPFLVLLLLLGMVAGLVYRMDEILYFMDHAGSAMLDVVRVVGILAVICGSGVGVLWMVLSYRLKKKALECHYKAEVLRCLPLSEEKGIPPAVLSRILSDPSPVAPPAKERKQKKKS